MTDQDKAGLAEAFGIHHDLVPFIPDLLADMWSMGIPTDFIVGLLRLLNLPSGSTRVLDLGCGKGAVSIALTRELGFSVTGIDFYLPFIEEARRRAVEMGVDKNCRFLLGDIRETVRDSADFDIVTFVWVGSVLGDLRKTVGALRRQVIPGGFMVVAAGYVKEGAVGDIGHGERVSREESLHQITAHGDCLLQEAVVPEDRMGNLYSDYLNSLRSGAQKVIGEHPEFTDRLFEHVQKQEQVCEIMKTVVVPAVWLIERNQGA